MYPLFSDLAHRYVVQGDRRLGVAIAVTVPHESEKRYISGEVQKHNKKLQDTVVKDNTSVLVFGLYGTASQSLQKLT